MSTIYKVYSSIDRPGKYLHRAGYVSRPISRSTPNAYFVDSWSNRYSDSEYPNLVVPNNLGLAYTTLSDQFDRFGPLNAKAYDQIYKKASGGKRAAAALTLFEWKSSLGMIISGAGSIARSAKSLRQGNIYGALRELNIRDPALKNKMSRQYGDGRRLDRLWLELNFGWGPLIDDIRAMCNVMSQEVPLERISSSASDSIDIYNRYPLRQDLTVDSCIGIKKLRYTTFVAAINPNLLLAKQLGLTNPLQVVWDAVPFSFALDWFLPVNKYLSSFDMSLGVTLGPLVTSKSVRTSSSQVSRIVYSPTEIRNTSLTADAYSFRRYVGGFPPLPSFRDRIVPPSGSLWQAATTVALATQQLIGISQNRKLSR